MSATITLESPTGSIEFSETTGYDAPLVSRRLDWNRLGEQGNSIQRITCQLDGFFTGNGNADITQMIDDLLLVLKSNVVTVTYYDGVRNVMDRVRCYVAGYGDPSEWKEYSSEYSIGMYYFQEPATDNEPVTWQPTGGATYEFSAAPSIARAYKPNRKHPRAPITTPNGVSLGNDVMVQLEGQLFAETPEALEAARVELCNAFDSDGILNFGGFYTQAMRVASYEIPSVYPMNWLVYRIDLLYETSDGVTEFNARREIDIPHKNVLIRENINCPVPPQAFDRNTSGQQISYSAKASGYDIAVLRQFLANELTLLVYPDGKLMPGGKEVWDEYGVEPSVSVTFSMYYPIPPVASIVNP